MGNIVRQLIKRAGRIGKSVDRLEAAQEGRDLVSLLRRVEALAKQADAIGDAELIADIGKVRVRVQALLAVE